MADYTTSKSVLGSVYPVNAGESTWSRTEPLITPEDVKELYMAGISPVSAMKDPFTGKAKVISDAIIAKFIDKAVGTAELETGLFIFPMKVPFEKKPWDRQEYDSFGYFQLLKRPVMSVERITVTLSNNDAIYEVPLEWVEIGNAQWGQVNIIPLTIAMPNGNPTAIPTSAGGALLLSIFQGKSQWVPAFFMIDYTVGFPDGQVPKVINQYIGTIAAMDILSQLSATYGKSSGSSLSIDGMSQSVSTPGPEIFTKRLKDLADDRKMLMGRLKNLYHLKFFSDNV